MTNNEIAISSQTCGLLDQVIDLAVSMACSVRGTGVDYPQEEILNLIDKLGCAVRDELRCSVCGSTDPHVSVGYPVCSNDDFHETWAIVPRRWRWLERLVGPKVVSVKTSGDG
jgi:hypothetical protein